jgi:hypothetical protein
LSDCCKPCQTGSVEIACEEVNCAWSGAISCAPGEHRSYFS